MIEKPESKLNKPEQEEPKISFNEIIKGLKEKITDSIGFYLRPKRIKKIKEFEENLQESEDISKAAGEFFRFLIPRSLKKLDEDNEYQHKEKKENYPQYEVVNDGNDEKIGDIYEEQKTERTLMQSRRYQFKQEDSSNIIEESVDNYLGAKANLANAALIVKNSATGIKLDLQQLLPNGVEFCPADLNNEGPVNLKSYNGSKDSQDDFCVTHDKQILYGDLTKKGNLLILMHEIAHAWQGVYYKGGQNFYEFHQLCLNIFNTLIILKDAQRVGGIVGSAIKTPLLNFLQSIGAEIDINNFCDAGRDTKEDEIKIM